MADKGKPEKSVEQVGENADVPNMEVAKADVPNMEVAKADVPNIKVAKAASGGKTSALEAVADKLVRKSGKRAQSKSPEASKSPPNKEGEKKPAKRSASRVRTFTSGLMDVFKYRGKKGYVDEERRNLCEEEVTEHPRVHPVFPEKDSGLTCSPPTEPIATNPDYRMDAPEKTSVSSAQSDYSSFEDDDANVMSTGDCNPPEDDANVMSTGDCNPPEDDANVMSTGDCNPPEDDADVMSTGDRTPPEDDKQK